MKDKYNNEVGYRIRSARETMGLSREGFSELCDISASFLSDVERGNKSITIKTLNKICTVTNVSADYIVFGDHKKNENISTILEMLNNLDYRSQLHASRILSEYVQAIQSYTADLEKENNNESSDI